MLCIVVAHVLIPNDPTQCSDPLPLREGAIEPINITNPLWLLWNHTHTINTVTQAQLQYFDQIRTKTSNIIQHGWKVFKQLYRL